MLILLLVSLFIGSSHLAFGYEEPCGTRCDNTTDYSANSAFSVNLALALTTLRNTTSATGFATTTSAAGNLTEDPATALALCRSSISSSECQLCVDAATLGIRRACPSQTTAQVWYTLCMVRYSKTNFINKYDNSIDLSLYDVRDAPDADVFYLKVQKLMQNQSYAAGASDKRSAVGRTSMLENRTIYGYVDCTRDINGSDCAMCLSRATDAILSCYIGKWAGWIATPSCSIQFNMDPVHDDWMDNPPKIDTEVVAEPSVPPAKAEVEEREK